MKSKVSARYKYSSAIQGFILWGGWAFYINSNVSFYAGIIAGFVQGMFSFFATLIVIHLLTKLYDFFKAPLVKLIVSPTIMIICLTSILILVHTLTKTQKIIATITPSLIVATLFISFTTYKLANTTAH